MDTKGRGAVAEYLQVVVPGQDISRVSIGDKMHHSVRRSLRVIEPMFEEVILNEQDCFGSPEGINKLLNMIPDENIRKDLEAKLRDAGTSKAVWDAFVKFIQSLRVQSNLPRKLNNIVDEVQLALMYPRLDINVTKGFNHLLKAPFCVHPKTGKVCVPFNASTSSKFDPTTVPTIK